MTHKRHAYPNQWTEVLRDGQLRGWWALHGGMLWVNYPNGAIKKARPSSGASQEGLAGLMLAEPPPS
jgi:hypothetical protein